MGYENLPANAPIDIDIFNKFSVESLDRVGYLSPFHANKGIGYLNAFQEITLPSPSFEIEPYIEGGWISPKQMNSGYVEWGELSLTKGFSTPMEDNPIYNLFFNTRFGYKYRLDFLIRIYSSESIDNNSGIYSYVKQLISAQRIVYAVIKGAVLSDISLVENVSSDSGDVNISEMTFAISDMMLGVYDGRKK